MSRARLLAEVLGVYARAWILLRRRPLPEALTALRAVPGDAQAQDPRRLARAVTRTLRALPTDSRCLVESATLVGLLARRGVDSALVLGVRPGEDFAAHAWVEIGGRTLLPAKDFERLAEM
ncbi:MAG: lasso peptide biosynthesis B2 protein [Solirubrobacteraceae bacterium]